MPVIPLPGVPKRSVLLILCALLILSVALRYPNVDHERQQTDSYFIHLLSSSIVDDGYARWVFNPLSWFGYYPFSYPSGVPFLLSEASMVMGLSVETSILMTNMMFASLFCLTMFILARSFVKRPELVLLAVLIAVVGARFVDTTYWNASARGSTVVLITLVIAVLLQARPGSSRSYYVAAIALGLGCFACHHMAVLLVPIAAAYAMSVFQTQYLFRSLARRRRSLIAISSAFTFVAIVTVAFLFFDIFGKTLLANLGSTWLFDLEPRALSVLVNILSAYTNQIGFVFMLVILGLPFILRFSQLGSKTMFLVNSLVVFVPLLGNQLYVSMVLAPFVAILGVTVVGLINVKHPRRRWATALVVGLVVSSIALPVWSTSRWNAVEYASGDTVDVGTDLYRDATYLRYNSDGGFAIANVGIVTSQVGANSGVGFLSSDIALALNGEITPEDVHENVIWSESRFPVNLYRWFQYEDPPTPDYYVKVLMVNGFATLDDAATSSEVRSYFEKHPKIMVFVDNSWDRMFVDSYSIRDSVFLEEISSCETMGLTDDLGHPSAVISYNYYASERSTLYMVNLFPA